MYFLRAIAPTFIVSSLLLQSTTMSHALQHTHSDSGSIQNREQARKIPPIPPGRDIPPISQAQLVKTWAPSQGAKAPVVRAEKGTMPRIETPDSEAKSDIEERSNEEPDLMPRTSRAPPGFVLVPPGRHKIQKYMDEDGLFATDVTDQSEILVAIGKRVAGRDTPHRALLHVITKTKGDPGYRDYQTAVHMFKTALQEQKFEPVKMGIMLLEPSKQKDPRTGKLWTTPDEWIRKGKSLAYQEIEGLYPNTPVKIYRRKSGENIEAYAIINGEIRSQVPAKARG